MTTLILLCGLPGAGKSSLAHLLASTGDWQYYEADDWMYEGGEYKFDPSKLKECHMLCQEFTRKRLKEGYNVIVSNTSTTEKEVATYAAIAAETGAQFVSLIVENRHGGESIHGVPTEKLEQMRNRFIVKL
jgi:predicted kinase